MRWAIYFLSCDINYIDILFAGGKPDDITVLLAIVAL